MLVSAQPLLGMKGVQVKGKDSLFTGERAYATQADEDRAQERMKKRFVRRALITLPLAWVGQGGACVGLAKLFAFSWSWKETCILQAMTVPLFAMAAWERLDSNQEKLLAQARVFRESEVQLDRSMIDAADNLHLHTISGNSFRALNEVARSHGEVLFDGSYYQEYQEALIAGVQDYFAQCAQLNINENWKNRNKVRIQCVRLQKMGNKALALKHWLPRDVCDLILAHAGFARYKASDWFGDRQLTERDILKLTGGHSPNHIIRIGSGRAMRINYMDDRISQIIEGYKRYVFLEERGWIRFVDAKDPEPSFSPSYVLSMRMPTSRQWSIYYDNGTHLPRFTTPDPQFFAQFYDFESDPAYQSVIARLNATDKQFAQKKPIKRRIAIYNAAARK
jgi:hypothetical protein